MADRRIDRDDSQPPLGIGFAIVLAGLLSLPLWGGIIWLVQQVY